MLSLSSLFNPSDLFGIWFSGVTNNFTGSLVLTLVFALFCIVILVSIFKMPDIALFVILFPVVALFSSIDTSFNAFVGIALLFFAITLWSLFPSK